MEPYIQDWLDILANMVNTNTYKLAFGLGVLECVSASKYKESTFNAEISLLDIGDCMIRYYWNQCFFFRLKQQPGDKVPTIYQQVESLIKRYKELSGSELPVWCDEGLLKIQRLDPIFLAKARQKVARTIPENVGWRFKNTATGVKEVYSFDPSHDRAIYLKKENIVLLREYAPVLSKLFSYKWSQLLEKWNESPRLLGKVIGASSEAISRHSLSKFIKPLSLEFGNGPRLDFYTKRPIPDSDLSIDHVIPWSYIYSDNIWNLVFTSRSNNSRKSNSTPSQDDIFRLKKRNDVLCPLLEGKFQKEMEESFVSNLVDRYYFGLTRSYL